MNPSIKLISTDFDGTLFTEFENPPIPASLLTLIGNAQKRGAKWVINTGREMSGLMESLARANIPIQPDYLILVEREIYRRDGVRYVPDEKWNMTCAYDHAHLFARVRPHIPALIEWVNAKYPATVYEDLYSPFCVIAGNTDEADAIHEKMNDFCADHTSLTVMRNDVYARFCHCFYNKGSTLAELTRQLGLTANEVFAAGDHLNDLPMLQLRYAKHLAAPDNAIEVVKAVVRGQHGYVSDRMCGNGVADALDFYLKPPTYIGV